MKTEARFGRVALETGQTGSGTRSPQQLGTGGNVNQLPREILDTRPLGEADCEIAEHRRKSHESAYTIRNNKNGAYVKLGQRSFDFLRLMNGETRIEDIVERLFDHDDEKDSHRILQFLSLLYIKEIILAVSGEDEVILQRHLGESHTSPECFLSWLGGRFFRTRIAFDADRCVTGLHDVLGRYLFNKVSVFAILLTSLVGIVLFALQLNEIRVSAGDLLKVKGSYVLGLPLVYIGALVVMILHECGHALTCKHFGRKVGAMGLMLYYGFPCFFTDVTDAWMLPKREQVLVDGAGLIVNMFIGAAFSIAAFSFSSAEMHAICLKGALLNFLAVALNLVPFLKYEGYYVIADLLDTPNLREEAVKVLLSGDCWGRA